MIKIDIVSGFLGAGKTTLIKKLIKEALQDTQIALIENEFGEIGIDSGFLKEAGVEIREMNSGCICCSLVGDFGTSLQEVIDTYHPERILIEPSGVGKLSDVMKAVRNVADGRDIVLNSAVAVVDAAKCKMYLKNFGEFFIDQIAHAGTIILSRTGQLQADKLERCIALIREHNQHATIVTTPWDQVSGQTILDTIENVKDLAQIMLAQMHTEHDHDHHHHHDADCTCGCHDHEDHTHHHHGGHGHHHHDAGEVFSSWGAETHKMFSRDQVAAALAVLEDEQKYGMVLRAKGMLPGSAGEWIYFDYVPGESDIRTGAPEVTGKICVIGSEIKEDALRSLFAI